MFRRFFVNMNEHAILEFLSYNSTSSWQTVAFYRSRLNSYAGFVGNAWPPTPELIRSWLKHQQDRGLKSGSVHASYRAARAWCNWLYRNRKIRSNPIDQVAPPPTAKRKIPRAPEVEEVKKLFAYLECEAENGLRSKKISIGWQYWIGIRDLALVSLLLASGVRVGELQYTELKHLNMDDQWLYVTDKGKDRQERYIPLNEKPRLLSNIRLWLTVREIIAKPRKKNWLFLSIHNKRLNLRGVELMLQRRCVEAEIEHLSPHQFRHAYAVSEIAAGTDIMLLRDRLGHSTIAVTDVYLQSPDAWTGGIRWLELWR